METEQATVSPIDQRERSPRTRALELYRTTDLSVTEIASQTRVSRDTVYRWLHQEGIAVGRTVNHIAAGRAKEQLRDVSNEIAELRREQTALIGQVRRLEGLIEALIGLKTQAV
jgi:excisionase family DNA binding protein